MVFGCLFFEVSACLDFEHVQHVFHEAVREARRELEKNSLARPLLHLGGASAVHQQVSDSPTAPPRLASCTFNTLSTASLKEMLCCGTGQTGHCEVILAQSKRKGTHPDAIEGLQDLLRAPAQDPRLALVRLPDRGWLSPPAFLLMEYSPHHPADS